MAHYRSSRSAVSVTIWGIAFALMTALAAWQYGWIPEDEPAAADAIADGTPSAATEPPPSGALTPPHEPALPVAENPPEPPPPFVQQDEPPFEPAASPLPPQLAQVEPPPPAQQEPAPPQMLPEPAPQASPVPPPASARTTAAPTAKPPSNFASAVHAQPVVPNASPIVTASAESPAAPPPAAPPTAPPATPPAPPMAPPTPLPAAPPAATPATPTTPAVDPQLAEIDRLIAQGQFDPKSYIAAHKALSEIYWKQPERRPEIQERIDNTARLIYFEPQPHLMNPYEVQSGDRLTNIAVTYKVPWEYLANLNHVDPQRIQAGQRLKVIKGPFAAVVDLSRFEMTVHHHGYYVRRYAVGIGKDGATPTGQFTVQLKEANPVYYGTDQTTGRKFVIDRDDPTNPLGERWIDLGDSYGIHGTIEPDSIGQAASRGCIRLRNAEVEEVYDLLGVGSTVVIRP